MSYYVILNGEVRDSYHLYIFRVSGGSEAEVNREFISHVEIKRRDQRDRMCFQKLVAGGCICGGGGRDGRVTGSVGVPAAKLPFREKVREPKSSETRWRGKEEKTMKGRERERERERERAQVNRMMKI